MLTNTIRLYFYLSLIVFTWELTLSTFTHFIGLVRCSASLSLCKHYPIMQFSANGGTVTIMMLFLIFVFAVAPAQSFNVNETCAKEYDLDFNVVGYTCIFLESGVYVIDGNPVDYVTFDRLDKQSYIYVDTRVSTIRIDQNVDCTQILKGRGAVEKIYVHGELCVSIHCHFDFYTTISITEQQVKPPH